MNLLKICRVGLLLAGALVLTGCGASKAGTPGAKAHPKITISKATTYITEPLTADGYPDYVAALNQRTSQGVTPENNAVVLLMQAFGPGIIPAKDRPRFFKMLGIPPLPDKGDYFVDYYTFVEKHDPDALKDRHDAKGYVPPRYLTEHDRAQYTHWRKSDCPLVAAWLAANEKPLARIVEASHRSHFFIPNISTGIWKVGYALGGYPMRELSLALRTRAMLRVGKGKTNQAWSDLLTCRRLVRRLSSTCYQWASGEWNEMFTDWCCWRLAYFIRITPKQAKKYLADINEIPLQASGMHIFCNEGRCEYLDAVCNQARGTTEPADVFWDRLHVDRMFGHGPSLGITELVASGLVDWNQVLRLGNEHYDQLAAAAQLTTWPERRKTLLALEHNIFQQAKKPEDAKLIISHNRSGGPDKNQFSMEATRRASAACLTIFMGYDEKSPGIGLATFELDAMRSIRIEMTKIALALSAYRTEHGEYPEKLQMLVPQYVDRLPVDPFVNGPLQYRRQDKGYLLYSVGANCKDDTGPKPLHGSFGVPGPSWAISDDVGIRMPDDPYEG